MKSATASSLTVLLDTPPALESVDLELAKLLEWWSNGGFEKAQEAQHVWKDCGRNDDCPCGSDKKFKKCCIGHPPYEMVAVNLHRYLDMDITATFSAGPSPYSFASTLQKYFGG